MREGAALVISAPSGAGKSTLCKKLLQEFPNLQYSISCTTRPRRSNEEDGKDYFFISRQEFEEMRDAGKFVEWAQVHGNLYGTPLEPVRYALKSGKDLLFDVDVQGAAQIKLNLPGAGFAFILPPDFGELARRLQKRNQDDPASIAKRLENARVEILEAYWYDALVLNDNLDKAYDDLRSYYISLTLAPARNANMLARLTGETG